MKLVYVDINVVLTVVYKHTNTGLNLLCRQTKPKLEVSLCGHVSNYDKLEVYLPLGTLCPLYRTVVSLPSHRTLFKYLINEYISLSNICLNVHH